MEKIDLYNAALLHCGERFVGSLAENREPRRLLDHVYATNGVRSCLEAAQWAFATRTVQIDYDPGVQPPFGYNRAFQKPSDWVLTCAVCEDEFFRAPSLRYVEEAGYWFADLDTLYVRYVSNDANYGMNMGAWPDSFFDFVAVHFASRIILKLSNNAEEEKKLLDRREKYLVNAKNRTAMAEPTTFPARGQWGLSRNRFPNRRDGGGTTGPLIG